jgi:O-antigen/teichoic acid export membrane protein
MKTEQNSFLSNSIITLTRQIASIIIGVILLVIIARGLGPKGQGEYTLITYLPLMLMTFLNLGLNSSTVYYVSKKDISVQTAFSTNVISALMLSLTSILIGVGAIFLLSESKFADVDLTVLYISLLALPGMFLMIFLQTILQGVQNFKVFNTALVIQQMSTVAFLVLFILLLDTKLIGAVLAFILGYISAVLFMFYILFTKYKVAFSFSSFSIDYLKSMLSYGMKAHISNMMTFLNYRLDILLLGYFLNSTSVGIYSVAVNIGERLSIFSQSISQVLLPRIASSNAEEDRNKISSMVSRIIMSFVFLLGLFVFIVSDIIFKVFFGEEYMASSIILRLLLPGLTVLAVEKILSNDLAGRGKPELNMYVSFFNVGFNVLLNLILIPGYGVKGAALASTITYGMSFLIKILIFRKVTNQKVSDFLIMKKTDIILAKKIINQLMKKTAIKRN